MLAVTPVFYNPKFSNSSPNSNLSFTGYSLGDQFLRDYKKLNITKKEFITRCRFSELIGDGNESFIYQIPFKGFEKFLLKLNRYYYEEGQVQKVENKFPHNNLGQTIISLGRGIEIFKKINGKSLAQIQDLNSPTLLSDIKSYYAKMANMPQKTFDDYIKRIITANKKGMKLDGNPGNIILKKNSLHLIDLAENPEKNQLADAIFPIFYKYNFSDEEIAKDKKKILLKLIKAAQKHNMKFNPDSTIFNLLYAKSDMRFKQMLDTLIPESIKIKPNYDYLY
jgi:hypothetical protein